MTNAFEPTGAEQTPAEGQATESFVSKLVAERGDVWSDPEVIAKGKLEADQHIKELENQLKQYREDQSKQDYAKQVLEELQKSPQTTPASAAQPTPGVTNEGDTSPEYVSEDKIRGLVEATLKQREQESVLERNLNEVNTKLAEMHGDKAAEVVSAKAAELGMSVERMQRLAEESPTAFMSLIGVAESKPKPITNGSVNTNALPNPTGAGVRDAAYYREMRKNDKARYYSPSIQRQMMADAEALGDKFRT